MEKIKRIKGIFCPIITPINKNEEIDKEGLKKLLNYICSKDIDGLILLGTAGEFTNVLDKEKEKLVRICKEEVSDEIPIIVGTGDCGTKKTIENCKKAEFHGADGLIILPPFYYKFDENSIIKHYEKITSNIDLPVIIYNYPEATKVKLSIKAIRTLAENENIIGIKNTSWDFVYFQEIIVVEKNVKNFSAIQGSDRLLYASLLAGANSAICITANISPKLAVDLYKKINNNEIKKAKELQDKILQLLDIVNKYGNFISGLKSILKILGICGEYVTEPFKPITKNNIKNIENELKELNIL